MPRDAGMLALENSSLRVLTAPERGGKIVSILDKKNGFELLYQSAAGLPSLTPGMRFDRGDASGFDDVFPSMGEQYEGALWERPLTLPDHGEIWTARMEVESTSGQEVRMRCGGGLLPYGYTKELRLDGREVRIRIGIRNRGEGRLPLLWVCHCLMRLEKDTFFVFPPGQKRLLCLPGCTYPREEAVEADVDDPAFCFQTAPPDGRTMKLYFTEPVTCGRCAACYPGSGMRAVIRFDARRLPWLGFWITTGGYRGESNFAFEPASAFYDTWTVAERYGRLPLLDPGAESVFALSLALESFDGKRESNFSTSNSN